MAKVIVKWYVHTGAAAVSAFFGHGKKSVMKNVIKYPSIALSLENVGKQLPLMETSLDNLRMCTIKMVYNDKRSSTLTEARTSKWNTMKKKSFSRLPPDEESHSLHAERVNYICYVNFNYMCKEALSSPKDNGWTIQDGKCYPLRYNKPALQSHVY